jgi:DNA-binding SARP family transcriptional activator
MSQLALYLLGPPRLERDGVPVEFRYRKNIALIAYLAVTGQPHTRETLITLLWPELDPGRARASAVTFLCSAKPWMANGSSWTGRRSVSTPIPPPG